MTAADHRIRGGAAAGLVALVAASCSGGAREPAVPDSGSGAPGAEPSESLRTPPMLQEFAIGGDFTLTDHNGERFALQEHRGQLFLMFLGYTSCPDFCPNTMARLAQAYDLLGGRSEAVTTLFVTVDPQRDTPEALAGYLDLFGVPARGLTGTDEELRRVAEAYAARYEIEPTDSAFGPLFAHTTYVYLIDQAGKVRYSFMHDDTARFIAAGIEQLLDADPEGI